MVQNFLKIFPDDFLLPAQNVSLLVAQLDRVIHEMIQLFQC